MMKSTFKAFAVAGVAMAGVGAAPAVAADNGNNAVEAGIAAYKAAYPQLSAAQARAAATGADARRAVYDAAAADAATFGGAWFEPTTGLVHVNTTTDAAAGRADAIGKQYAVAVKVHKVKRSAAQLEADAEKIRRGNDELGRAARENVGIDVVSNEVVVALPSDKKSALAATAAARGAKVVTASSKAPQLDADCTARNTCDWTIRAGIVMWRGTTSSNTPWCSVGFTGRNSSGTRFVLTAGHCSTGAGVNWGTWNQNIGPMGTAVDSGVVDTARIQVTNSWFTGDSGGQIYVNPGISGCCDLKGVAPTVSYMVAGETVCLSANFTQPATNGNSCGILGTNSDASVRGMARVDGLDACGGDSGGGWYWLSSSGNRYAYGIHSRSDSGCHGSAGGSRSWYTPVASAKANANFSSINIETR